VSAIEIACRWARAHLNDAARDDDPRWELIWSIVLSDQRTQQYCPSPIEPAERVKSA
jgi:hypothetical protein